MSIRSEASRVPTYRRHKPTGQAVVTLNGRDFYLGKWNTKASRHEYDRLIREWLANGRCLPDPLAGVSVAELGLAYWRYAKRYYHRPNGNTGEVYGIKSVVRLLRTTYGSLPAADFGPRKLKELQHKMVKDGLCRSYVNAATNRLRRLFKWGVAEELVPPPVFHALQAVPGLRKGHTNAREAMPIGPVADEVVEATLPYLPEIVADMVRLQRLTGCRPGEVCMVRPCDIDTSGDVWVYRPESHKTEHHGKQRAIAVGPRAQEVLRPYLLRDKGNYCFVPAESEKRRRAAVHECRRTPLSCGNQPGTNRKRCPKRKPGRSYITKTYRRAIKRAVNQVNRNRSKEAEEKGEKPDLLEAWSPNRLRHSAATEIRKQFGLEAAQVTLGHATADVTQVYAERDLELATKIMRKIG